MASFENVWINARARLTIRTTEDSVWFRGQPEAVFRKAKLFPNWVEGHLMVSFADCNHCGRYYATVGFKLLFTFHEHASLPSQNPDTGLWNCAVPHWPQFKVHLACNMWVQCHGGQDEDGCNYTRCASSGFSVNGRCYIISRQATTTAVDAQMQCAAMGARLATMKSSSDVEKIISVLSTKFFLHLHVGLRSDPIGFPSMYKKVMTWSDMTVAYTAIYKPQKTGTCRPCCGLASPQFGADRWGEGQGWKRMLINLNSCFYDYGSLNYPVFSLCETARVDKHITRSRGVLPFQPLNGTLFTTNQTLVSCHSGHVTYCFLAIAVKASCWDYDVIGKGAQLPSPNSSLSLCSRFLTALPLHFVCEGSSERLPYTLVCDHRQDCWDNSDEDFCVFPPCTGDTPLQCATSQQCHSHTELCNGVEWCIDNSDEKECPLKDSIIHTWLSPPAIVSFDEVAGYTMRTLSAAQHDVSDHVDNRTQWPCPQTHFQCPDNGYCLPVFVRCNGVYDCSQKEDEERCKEADCTGYYRCRGSAVCLHPDHVCDGIFQCPQRDDELICDLVCPTDCICLGLAFKCFNVSTLRPTHRSVGLRALDMSGSNTAPSQLAELTMLIYLNLERCQLTNFRNISFVNLQIVRLGSNSINTITIHDLVSLPNLKYLHLSQNPITSLFSDDLNISLTLPTLRSLDLSSVDLPQLDVSIFNVFPNLLSLNLSKCSVESVLDSGLRSLSKLQVMDMRGCAVLEFPPKLFLDLEDLRQLYGDTYKLCCPQVLPAGFNPSNCHTIINEISSCNNLLKSNMYRLFLALFAMFTLVGNVLSLLLRLCFAKAKEESGYSVFVRHLCISDGIMGVYLVIVGVADRLYQNTYLWQDIAWKNSVVCKTAGFLALLSTEMSAFIICLITVDRYLVIRLPFSQLRFHRRSGQVVCCMLWVVVIVIVSVPFFPPYIHWGFYSHTDICIPLPITRSSFAGHSYAFGVMIVLNMVLFLAIVVGQTAIYIAIRSNTMTSTDSNRKQQDLNIARRLATIAVTDFLCWFPVGLLGLLASTGTAVPGEVNVTMATLVIPLNSAMNPVLYTMNVVLEKRRHAREERIIKCLMSHSNKNTDSFCSKRSKRGAVQ